MKVIFLDVDGVLNNNAYIQFMVDHLRVQRPGYHLLDPLCVMRLNKIVAATGAELVLSSTWRILYTVDEFNMVAGRQGVPKIIDSTERHVRPPRGKEIQTWLDAHDEVETFIILDDDDDMAHLRDRLVLVKNWIGLQDQDVEKAINMLNET